MSESEGNPLSLRAYARRRGVSPEAVSKAVSSGRLSASVTRASGKPAIADPELADREWTANTRPSIDRPAVEPDAGLEVEQAPTDRAPRQPIRATPPGGIPDYADSRALREAAAARREAALADMAELDRDERKGELVSVAEARADVVDRFAIVRTRLLGIPSRVAQRMPHVAGEVVPVLDDLLREALEELAVDGDSKDADDE